ncbi:hypothetical protein GPECTOR_125g514 [Gonium pectorale]|uniref:Apple domain-containing protein n=1 Tax=Gonium pectorale TaxID=33097 RepID=A0A150FYJ6_GONPE|nr:hypothetical protein GPECTOR_125g514 [Gonium pectorale]|eukprot:KXZ42681.1 hypothetical protein GPECTOR_125g514 [Gonium pectorale]
MAAFYGRTDNATCPWPFASGAATQQTSTCASAPVAAQSVLCRGRRACDLFKAGLLDPCPGFYKWYEVNVTCTLAGDLGCEAGVDVRGRTVGVVGSASREECRDACVATDSCVFSVRLRDAAGTCILRSAPLTGPDGETRTDPRVDQTCWSRSTEEGSTAGLGFACAAGVGGEALPGRLVADSGWAANLTDCMDRCSETGGCSYILYGEDARCVLLNGLFRGSYLHRNASFVMACFRVAPDLGPGPCRHCPGACVAYPNGVPQCANGESVDSGPVCGLSLGPTRAVCPPGTVLGTMSAFFGRADNITCAWAFGSTDPQQASALSCQPATSCRSAAFASLHLGCLGRQLCYLAPPSSVPDPCAEAYKWTSFAFTCSPAPLAVFDLGPAGMPPWNITNFPDPAARWIWVTPNANIWAAASPALGSMPVFQKVLDVPASSGTILAALTVAADSRCDAYLNESYQGSGFGGWLPTTPVSLPMLLSVGSSRLSLRCHNAGADPSPAGVLATLLLSTGTGVLARTDASWSVFMAPYMPEPSVLGESLMRPWNITPAAPAALREARWIWSSPGADAYAAPNLVPTFYAVWWYTPNTQAGRQATLLLAVDDHADVFWNGIYVRSVDRVPPALPRSPNAAALPRSPNAAAPPSSSTAAPGVAMTWHRLALFIFPGHNLLSVRVFNEDATTGAGGPAGLLAVLLDADNVTVLRSGADVGGSAGGGIWQVHVTSVDTVCSPLKGFTARPNMDGGFDLIAASHVTEAFIACRANDVCRGFNSRGVMKRVVTAATMRVATGTCLYVKV